MFVDPEEIKTEMKWSRAELIRAIDREDQFDVVVVGGGIHGAAVARLAAFNGLKTALFEKSDYASATSSRSSKLAHGGLRYLAMGDFKQVFESVKAREELFRSARHLVRPYPFLIPVEKGRQFQRLKLACGLMLYDLFSHAGERAHCWVSGDDPAVRDTFLSHASNLSGCYRYYDGLMSDARLTIETVYAARQEGARCLNYARVDSAVQRIGNQVEVGWTDVLRGTKHQVRCGVVINCAGPWAPNVGRLTPLPGKVTYSQGSHLIFDYPWEHPALFLPLSGKNRYYFVLPHPAGTMVGTTERELNGDLPADPLPTSEEVDEILHRIQRDLPEHRLNRETLSYGFAGIRTLALRGNSSSTALISRRHLWEFNGGMLTLYGGKYTSAYWTAYEGLKIVQATAGKTFQLIPLGNRDLPGAFNSEGALEDLLSHCENDSQRKAAISAYRIFGGRVREFFESPRDCSLVSADVLHGSLRLAVDFEQVEKLEDVMRRRLELEYQPANGLASLESVASYLSSVRPEFDGPAEIEEYRRRLNLLRNRLGLSPVSYG